MQFWWYQVHQEPKGQFSLYDQQLSSQLCQLHHFIKLCMYCKQAYREQIFLDRLTAMQSDWHELKDASVSFWYVRAPNSCHCIYGKGYPVKKGLHSSPKELSLVGLVDFVNTHLSINKLGFCLVHTQTLWNPRLLKAKRGLKKIF